jgi:hypothetical protein
VAEGLADGGSEAAEKYIDQIAAIVPSDAQAIRAHLQWKQGKAAEAVESLKRFLQIAHDDPWPDPNLTKRSIVLAETIASSAPAAASSLYEMLRTPFCIWNNDADRELRLVSIGMRLDGNKPGGYTARAIEAFEPNVIWERNFLETRKAVYEAVHNPRAAPAARDFDEFMQREALTNDGESLTREIEIGAAQHGQTPR